MSEMLTREQIDEHVENIKHERDRWWTLAVERAQTIESQQQEIARLKDSLQYAQDLAATRGETILAATEKWAARRRYHRTQFKAVVALKKELERQLAEAQARIATLEGEP